VNWRGDVSASQLPMMQAAQNSAQVFLGVNLKCNSCHDSFISKWKLKDAYGLAAFFSDSDQLELVRCDNRNGPIHQCSIPVSRAGWKGRSEKRPPIAGCRGANVHGKRKMAGCLAP